MSRTVFTFLVSVFLISCSVGSNSIRQKAVCAPAQTPADYHFVATSGSDNDDGSRCRPWATIQHAADVVNPGDTVVVEDGSYPQTINFHRGGTAAAPVVFTAEHKWGARLVPSQQRIDKNGNRIVNFTHVSYLSFSNFEVVGTPATSTGIKVDSGTYNTISGNSIHDVGVSTTRCEQGAAILVADSNNTVAGNRIYNISPPRGTSVTCNTQHGIYVGGKDNRGGFIQNNVISQVWQGWGIHMYGTFAEWTVSNNTIVDISDSLRSGGPLLLSCTDASYSCDGVVVTNNILALGGRYCLAQFGSLGTHNRYHNNLLYHCGPNLVVSGQGLQKALTADPRFANATASNYHLLPGSPAIDQGTSIGAPKYDFDLVPRPQGAGFDIGAYEYKP